MSPKRKFRTTTQRLSRVNAIERLPGESQMDAAFRVYKKDHPRTKFGPFCEGVSMFANTNESASRITEQVNGIGREELRRIREFFQLRTDEENRVIVEEAHSRINALEYQPGGAQKVQKLLNLMDYKRGLTLEKICEEGGVDESVVLRLMERYPHIRPKKEHERIGHEVAGINERQFPHERLEELLKERIIRRGRVDYAHSIAEIIRKLRGEGVTVHDSAIQAKARKLREKTGRSNSVEKRLGGLSRQGKLYDNTEPYQPGDERKRVKIPKPQMVIGKKVPWYFDREGFDGTDHRTLEHYFRLGDVEQGIDVVGRRGMGEAHARRVLEEIEEHYKGRSAA